MEMQTIIWRHGEVQTVPALCRAGGLCLTVLEDDDGERFYTVTHAASGRMVFPRHAHQRIRDAERARAAFDIAVASGVDWRKDSEALIAEWGKPALCALFNKMRLTVWPPKRWRWHGERGRRRPPPYRAATKRSAIREARAINVPWLWPDLWAYHKRSEMWGILPKVVRQPCRRFGVTRAVMEEVYQ
jgi:hypothetical protein